MVRRAYLLLRTLPTDGAPSSASDALRFRKSEILRSSGNASGADRIMSDFERFRSNSPETPRARLERGIAALELNNDSAAATHMHVASELALKAFEVREDTMYRSMAHLAVFWEGASLARLGHHKEAIDVFQHAVQIDSTGEYASEALFAIGQVYERNGDFTKSIEYFNDVYKRYPGSRVAQIARVREAQNHLLLRRPERALDILSGLPSTNSVVLLRASSLIMRGRYDLGLDSCKRILDNRTDKDTSGIEGDPAQTITLTYLHAGYAELHLGKNIEAEKDLQRVIDSTADHSSPALQQALLYHAVALKRNGELEAAARDFAELSAQPDYPYQSQALVEVGQGAYERGAFDEAQKIFERAERSTSDPSTLIRARLLLGATLIEKQQWTKAAQVYERAEQLASTATDAFVPNKDRYLAEARLKRGICLVQANERRDGISALTEFLGKHPEHPQRDEATFWLAEAMYKADLLKNAQEQYEEIVKKYTASIRREEAMYGLAWTYFRRREFGRSIDAFGDLVKAYPDSRYAAEALVRRGDGLYVTKQFKAAATQYAEAANKNSKSEEGQYAAFQAGNALYRAGDLNEASSRLRTFVSGHSSSKLADDALFLIGWIEFQQRNDAGAITEFNKLLAAYPDGDQAVRALYTIADAQYNLGQIEEALNTYDQVFRRYPSHPLAAVAVKNKQQTLLGLGRTEEALAISDSLISDNPNSIVAEEIAIGRSQIFYSGKNYTSAAAELESYIKKYPSSQSLDEALYMLGKTYLSMEDLTQANNSFNELEKKFSASPLTANSKLDLATYYDSHANSAKADSLYAIVTEKYSDDTANASRAGFERATLSRARGDSTLALEYYLQNSNRYPGTEYGNQSRYQVAMYYRKNLMADSAIYHLTILARTAIDPMITANALHDIGEMHQRNKQWLEAVAIFERVRKEFAGYEDWYTLSLLGLGYSYEQLGLLDEAKSAYAVVAELRPDDDYGKTALSRIKRIEKVRR